MMHAYHHSIDVEVDTAITFSNGSAYEGKGEEVRLVGAAAARFSWNVRLEKFEQSDSELQRDAIQNGGLPRTEDYHRGCKQIAELDNLRGP
jgi:hypothetical protein